MQNQNAEKIGMQIANIHMGDTEAAELEIENLTGQKAEVTTLGGKPRVRVASAHPPLSR